jgi:hypothetical protein
MSNDGKEIPGAVFEGIATSTGLKDSNSNLIYEVSGTVDNIGSNTDEAALFVTGPKHLPTKYGQDKQSDWYNTSVGNLSLETGSNSYDFSTFVLKGGDLTGSNENGVPDGKINSLDYVFFLEQFEAKESGPEGVTIMGDLNGDCIINTLDVPIISRALMEINGQLY